MRSCISSTQRTFLACQEVLHVGVGSSIECTPVGTLEGGGGGGGRREGRTGGTKGGLVVHTL